MLHSYKKSVLSWTRFARQVFTILLGLASLVPFLLFGQNNGNETSLTLSTKIQPISLGTLTQKPLDITAKAQIFIDKESKLNISQVIDQEFKPASISPTGNLFIPFSDDAYWFRWVFEKSSDLERKYLIQFKNEQTEFVEIYQFNDSLSTYTSTGFTDMISAKRKGLSSGEPIVQFTLKDKGPTEIYVRLRSQRGIVLNVIAFPQSQIEEVLIRNYGRMTFMNGALIFRLILILILGFFIVKVNAFRAYSFLIVLKTLGFWGLINYLGPLFTNNPLIAQKIDYLAYTANPYGIVLLTYVLLPLKQFPKWVTYLLFSIVITAFISDICVILNYNWLNLKVGIAHLTVSTAIVFSLFFYAYYKGITTQYYYAIPFLLGIGSYFLFNLRVLIQTEIPFAAFAAFVLFVGEILIFIFFLGKIFRDSETAQQTIQQNLIEKEQVTSQLKELDKLKNRFFTNISHELKTPLTLITGPIEVLSKRYPADQLLQLVKPNINRLQDLVSQLLDIQKLEAGKEQFRFEKIDLPQHLRLHILSYESMAEVKSIQIELKQSHEHYQSYVDLDKVNKIVDNLITNAIKYSYDGKRVVVKATYLDAPSRFVFTVKDEGYGIAQKDIPHIFDRFYQVDNNNYQGSGVGLALVKELTETLKGTISVKSELEKGTEFEVSLPIGLEQWEKYIVEEPHKPNIQVQGKESLTLIDEEIPQSPSKDLLLIVEDNEDLQRYLKLLLQDKYKILQAYNGEEGVTLATHEVPDIVLCDLMMPKLDGFGFTEKLRRNKVTSHIPVIMLTAKNTKQSRIEGYESGIDQFLSKPFDPEELFVIIKKSLENRKILRQHLSKGILLTENNFHKRENKFIEQVNQYLETCYHRTGLSVSEIATDLKMSDTQLRRKLKSLSGSTSIEYLRKFRLNKAQEQLKKGGKSVSEVAFEVGFENLSYFSKTFQQEFGKLPSDLL